MQYEVADAFEYALNCHCSNCRRATGSAFKPFGGVKLARLRLIADESHVLIHGGGDAHDVHCRLCGSLLYSAFPPRSLAHVTFGTLVDTPSLHPTAHIFVGSKAPWFDIRDDLPQHDEFPP
ncbi:MAG TPA: GFA family protein [Steroidobacteraceae bacterium]|nr:GFA family protein [Steroidobacteraceae bacterium]